MKRFLILMVFVMALSIKPVGACLAHGYSFDELWEISDYVFRGEVTKVTTHLGFGDVYRIAEIKVDCKYKNQVEDTMCVKMPGETVWGFGYETSHSPKLKQGKEYVILGHETGHTHRGRPIVKIANLFQGVYRVSEGTIGKGDLSISLADLENNPTEITLDPSYRKETQFNIAVQEFAVITVILSILVLLNYVRARGTR